MLVPLSEIEKMEEDSVCYIMCPQCGTRADFVFGDADVIGHIWKICKNCKVILFVDLHAGPNTPFYSALFKTEEA